MNQDNLWMNFQGFTVLFCSKEKQDVIFKEIKEQLLSQNQLDIMMIQNQWPFFPYLKLKDHVFLNLPEKQKKANHLWYPQLQIDSSLFKYNPDELTALEKIKLQLLHAILAQKKELIIEDPIDKLTIPETQELLDILSYLVKDQLFSILLITHDQTVASSPFVDHYEEAS